MLVLSRKNQEAIVIGDGKIVIRVLAIGSDRVRLGIVAPEDVPVHREEVYEKIHGLQHHDEPLPPTNAEPAPDNAPDVYRG